MIIVRCTGRLIKASRVSLTEDPPSPTALLGEWYANVLHLPFRGRSLVVFAHDPSRLVVVAPGRTLKTTVPAFRERVPRLLERLGIPDVKIRRQMAEMAEVLFTRTVDRRMVGSLTDICHCIRAVAEYQGTPARFDLDDVEDQMAEMPSLVRGSSPDRMITERLVARTLR